MSADTLHFGRFELRTAERRLLNDGQPVALGSRAFDLLAALVARRERVVPREELMNLVWPGLVVEDNNLQVQISALRKLLGAQAIATVPLRGYQFTLAAEAAAPAAPAPPRTHEPRAAAPRGSRLLVADDNKVNRLLLCRSLELMGHAVASADNGRAALDKLRAEPFDLLLLDLEMPEVDGFGLLEQRLAEPALQQVPVIVTSSLEGVAQVARCIELGADDYLHKPVNPVLLKARVDSSLERKHWRDRQRELVARVAPGLAADAVPGHRVEATVLAARLSGFDALAQPAAQTLELLSHWTTLMLAAVEAQGGRVQQLGGDGLTAAFGALPDEPVSAADGAPWAGLQAALEMRELVALFNAERVTSGLAPLGLALGLARGEVVAGSVATPRRADFVCVGAAVQRAAELADRASGVPSGVLLDAATQAALQGRVATDAVPSAAFGTVPVYALRAG